MLCTRNDRTLLIVKLFPTAVTASRRLFSDHCLSTLVPLSETVNLLSLENFPQSNVFSKTFQISTPCAHIWCSVFVSVFVLIEIFQVRASERELHHQEVS